MEVLYMKKAILFILVLSIFQLFVYAEEGVRYEAEEGTVYLCNIAGHTGDHVAQINDAGAYVEFALHDSTTPGVYKLIIYYAAALEGDNSHTIFINDEKVEQIMYPQSSLGWSNFSEDVFVETEITLPPGLSYLRLEKTEEDNGFAELDAIRLIPITLYTPEPATPTPEPTEEPSPTPTSTENTENTTAPTATASEDADGDFNYLYIIVPGVVLVAAIVVFLIIKRKR